VVCRIQEFCTASAVNRKFSTLAGCRNPVRMSAIGRQITRLIFSANGSKALGAFTKFCSSFMNKTVRPAATAYQDLSHPLVGFACPVPTSIREEKSVRASSSAGIDPGIERKEMAAVSAARISREKSRSVVPSLYRSASVASRTRRRSSCAHQNGRAFRSWRGGRCRSRLVPVIRA